MRKLKVQIGNSGLGQEACVSPESPSNLASSDNTGGGESTRSAEFYYLTRRACWSVELECTPIPVDNWEAIQGVAA